MDSTPSSRMARSASRALRARVRSAPTSMFLATCWVMVEAPPMRRPEPYCSRLVATARRMPTGSTPWCSPEALVLRADEGLGEAGRNGLDGHEDPPLGGEFGHEAAVGGVDARHLRRLVVGQPAVIGQVGRHLPVHHVAGQRAAGTGHQHDQEHEMHELGEDAAGADAAATAVPPRRFLARRRRRRRRRGRRSARGWSARRSEGETIGGSTYIGPDRDATPNRPRLSPVGEPPARPHPRGTTEHGLEESLPPLPPAPPPASRGGSAG